MNGLNGIENAVAAAGPTPDYVPDFKSFQRIATLFRKLQIERHVLLEHEGDVTYLFIDPDAGAEGTERHVLLEHEGDVTYLFIDPDAGAEGTELRSLLKLDPTLDRYAVVTGRRAASPSQITVQGRSLLSVMFFLSQAVEVPDADRKAGKVTTTHDADGTEFDWIRRRPMSQCPCSTAATGSGSRTTTSIQRPHLRSCVCFSSSSRARIVPSHRPLPFPCASAARRATSSRSSWMRSHSSAFDRLPW